MGQRILHTFFLLCLGGHLFCQSTEPKKVTIETSCGYSGEVSDAVADIHELVRSKDTSELLRIARLDNIKWRLLAIIALENLNIPIPSDDKAIYDNIAEFKRSKKVVYICTDCEGHTPTKIRDLFRKEKTPLRKDLDYAIRP